MPIDFNKITNNDEFIDYFIYFYEYTFTLTEMDDFDVKDILKNIVNKKKYDNYKDLWIYAYLYISNLMLGDLPLEFLKDTIQRLMNNFTQISPFILEIQLELLKDTFHTLGFVALEPRPYEQLYKNDTYGVYILGKSTAIMKIFEKYKDSFSDSSLNQACYVKLKNNKYMNKISLLFEFYSVVLFNIINEIRNEKSELDKTIDSEIHNFIKSFKRGKFNKDLLTELNEMTKNLVKEYLVFGDAL